MRKIKQFMAMLLALLTVLGGMATPALAAEQELEPGAPGSLTERFVDEATGRELAGAVTSKSGWVKEAPVIDGYEYRSFSQETRHVYSQEDLTYIFGYPDKTVRGEGNLTRAEAAAIFCRLYDGVYPELVRQMNSQTFTDTPKGAWYYKELETCYNVGIVSGKEKRRFYPNEPITRAEFAVLAANFAQLANSDKTLFSDVSAEHWAQQKINAAAEAGWIHGYGDGTFRPDSYITRSETVTLVNRMLNRAITAEGLKKLGVVNPYTDLVETYWGYADLLEATVKHAAADWHELNVNSAELNKVIERFVDSEGKEIAQRAVTNGQENTAPRSFGERRYYLGYTTTVTYVYSKGTAAMTLDKTVDKAAAKVGDTLTYTITAGNGKTATADVRGAAITDALPKHLSFVYGSVMVDGRHAEYAFDPETGALSVYVGDLKPGQSREVTFLCTVKEGAYGQKLENTAVLTAEGSGEKPSATATTQVEDGDTAFTATKTVDKETARVGDTLTYTVTAANGEKATAAVKGAVLEDTLPRFIDLIQGTVMVDGVSVQYAYDTGRLAVALGDLEPGASKTVTFQAVVKKSAYGQRFQNTAVIKPENGEPVTPSDPGVQVEAGKPGLSVTKAVDKSQAQVGDTLVYTITAGNSQEATADVEDAVLSDVIPEHLSFTYGSVLVDGQTVAYAYDTAIRKLSVELGNIAPGQTKTVTFAAVIRDSAYGQKWQNTATVKGSNTEETPGTDPGTQVEDGKAGLSASKAVDKETARVGDTLTYTITVGNDKTATASAKNAAITDTLPRYVDFVQGSVQVDGESGAYTYEDGRLAVKLGDVAPGTAKTVTFQAVVNKSAYGQRFHNTAVIQPENSGPVTPSDPGVQVETGKPGLSVTKAVDKSQAQVGDTLVYTIAAANSKDATADVEDAVLSDVIPEHLSFTYGSVLVDGQTAAYAYDAATRKLSVELGNIAPGSSKRVSFAAVVRDSAYGQKWQNTAVVKGSNTEETPGTDPGTQVEDGKAGLSASKAVDKETVRVGDTLTYTITVGNDKTATANAKNTAFTDTLPRYVDFVQGSVQVDGESGAYTYKDGQLAVKLGDIAPGQTKTVAFQALVNESAYGQRFYNTAAAQADNSGPVTPSDPGVQVEDGTPSLSVTKAADKNLARVGDTITYTVTASNAGTATAPVKNAVLRDVLSQHLAFQQGSAQVDGNPARSSFDSKTQELAVELGDIAPGQTKTVTFAAVIRDSAYGQSFTNTAAVSGDNAPWQEASDRGVAVEDGKAALSASKSADKKEARVGDTITYTVTASNSDAATVPLRNVTMRDVLSGYLTFHQGSVLVDGSAARTGFDSKTRELVVELGDIAPGQTTTVSFTAAVNTSAYGMEFGNTAVLKADNAPEKEASDNGIVVAAGVPEGSSGSKMVSQSRAKVGDTLTYSIALRNAATATADWTGVELVDVIPEHLSFIPGSVEVDGRASTSYGYNAGTKALTLYADRIAPGQTQTFTFRVTVEDGAQGLYIVNTAVAKSPDREDIQLPDTGVEISGGEAVPHMVKTASVKTAQPGDTFRYTLEIKNGARATADWKDIILTDVVPQGVELAPGTLTRDGETVSYSLNGQVLEVPLGSLKPNESATVSFWVTVLESAADNVIRNVATAKGSNGEKTASDEGVTVGRGLAQLSGSKTADKTAAKVGDTLTYTITAKNSEAVTSRARNVTVTDRLSEYLTFHQGSVLVDGSPAAHFFDPASRRLRVELGDIAPGQTRTVSFTAVVNSTAYGKHFGNTAVLEADNAEPVTVATPNEVEVDPGTAEGSVGAKTVSKSKAQVGDELTYSIQLRNAALATADWTGVELVDVIPEHLSFIPGSVEVDGRASTSYGYNAGTKALTLYADRIAPGQTQTFTFRVTVEDGAQGLYIVNTAVAKSPDREDIQLPDTGVEVDAGEAKPIMTKKASVQTAQPGDIFSYDITLKNGANATADWKNVIVTDTIPAGLEFVSGSPRVDGVSVAYVTSGRTVEIPAGSLKPNEAKTVTLEVRVLDSAAGSTVTNMAVAKGDNGEKTGTDPGVAVPELQPEPGPDEPLPEEKEPTGSKTVDKTVVKAKESVTYTITATNNSDKVWAGVKALDTLDDSLMYLLDDTIFIDGVNYRMGSSKWSFSGRELMLDLGDIQPGRSVSARFKVEFKNDAAGHSFVNRANLRSSSHDTVLVKAPEVVIIKTNPVEPNTEIHYGLFSGHADPEGNSLNLWAPNDPINIHQVCLVAYNILTDDWRDDHSEGLPATKTLPGGTVLSRSTPMGLAAIYMLENGYLTESEFAACKNNTYTGLGDYAGTTATKGWAVSEALAFRILASATKMPGFNNYISTQDAHTYVKRIDIARAICTVCRRDTSPDTGSVPLKTFTDKGSYGSIIDEVSNGHITTIKEGTREETWVAPLN